MHRLNTIDEFPIHTKRFFDRFAQGKFGLYLLDRHDDPPAAVDRDAASRRIEESQLFIEAAHACETRLTAEAAAEPAPTGA